MEMDPPVYEVILEDIELQCTGNTNTEYIAVEERETTYEITTNTKIKDMKKKCIRMLRMIYTSLPIITLAAVITVAYYLSVVSRLKMLLS